MDTQYFHTPANIRHAQRNLTVKAAWTSQCSIKGIRLVCCANEHDLTPRGHTIHQGEQLPDDTPLNFSACLGTFGCQGIQFVNEDDTRCPSLCLLENATQA